MISIWCDPLTWTLALMQSSLETISGAERTRTGQELSVSVLAGHTSVRAAASTSPPPTTRQNPRSRHRFSLQPITVQVRRVTCGDSYVGSLQNQGEDASQQPASEK